MPLAEQPSALHSHPRTCPEPSYAPVSIRCHLFSSFCTRRYPSLSRLRQPRSLPPSSLFPTLARTILSIFRHRLLEKILRGPSFATASTISSSSSSSFSSSSMSSLLQGIAPVTLLWTEARSWHSLGAACSSGKVALGACNVRCKTD